MGSNPLKITNLLLPQVSKISIALYFAFLLVFQQNAVGSDAYQSLNDSIPENISDTSLLSPAKSDSLVIEAGSGAKESQALKSKIKYQARDSIRADLQSETIHLYGNASVDYEDLHLEAEYIMINMNEKVLTAEGRTDSLGQVYGTPNFSQGPRKFRSNNIRYNFETKKGRIAHVITQEGDGFIHGEVVKKDPENNFFIKYGQYTTCNLDTPHFSISANKLKVISNNKIVTGPANLSIEKVPTPLFIPFGFFPNKKGRSSGLIFPSFGESAQRGFYFQHLGYYFGFSDYINLALTSDLYTKGSYTLDAASVYRKRYRYSGNLRLSYAYSVTSERELPDFNARKDFHVNWTHAQDAKASPYRSFSANVNAGSSQYYQNTISSVNNFLSNTFQSSISYSKVFADKPINLGLSMNHTQNTITRDIRVTSPDLSFNVSRINPFKRKVSIGAQKWYEKIGTNYSLRATNYIQTKDSLLFKSGSLNEFQNGVQHSVPVSTSFKLLKYFTLSPSVNYTERWYFKTTQFEWNEENRKLDTIDVKKFQAARDYQFNAGLTTRVYGMYQVLRGPVKAVRHVMTPAVSFSYRPDFSQESFGYYKSVQIDTNQTFRTYSIFQNTVYGGPGAGKFGSLGFGLDNNLEMKVRTRSDTGATDKKIKLLESLRFGANYNLMADSLNWSPLSVSGRTTLLERISVNIGMILNPYAFDENNIDYDRFLIDETGKLFRLTNANMSVGFSLNRISKKITEKYSRQELDYIYQNPENYIDFDVPYNVSVNYTYAYSKRGNLESIKSQSASINGDFSLTPAWKIGFNSWYDIEDGRFTNFGVNIYRDLHCWEMRMNWIPFGLQESYNFQINVKAAILQDLKLIRKKDFYDR
ncbi:MAG: LPS-assembly protein LptD [Bacteroidetes bacterium]|nr:MAG: LPS-assembly protein LptD [Bacteroidota bacterium]